MQLLLSLTQPLKKSFFILFSLNKVIIRIFIGEPLVAI